MEDLSASHLSLKSKQEGMLTEMSYNSIIIGSILLTEIY